MSDPAKAETQEIIDEISEEEGKQEGDQPSDQPAPADDGKKDPDNKQDPKPEPGKEEGKGEEGKPADQQPAKRTPGLMPKWVHERAKSDYEGKISDLTTALEEATKGKQEGQSSDTAPSEEQQKALEQEVSKVAEEHGLKPELVKSLVELGMKFGGKLPAEVQEKLKAVDDFKAAQEVAAEESAFQASFDKDIVPLIKAEYGEDLDPDTIQKIRTELMEKAYSDEFANTPLGVLYKGHDSFRGFTRTAKKSAEPSRGGEGRSDSPADGDGANEDEEFANVTDEDIDKMDTATFDRYTKWAEASEKKRNNS